VVQLVETRRYKPEGRGFHSGRCHWNFSLILRPHYGPGVDSASKRNEYQEYLLRGGGGRRRRRRPVRRADNVTTFMYRLFESLGASIS